MKKKTKGSQKRIKIWKAIKREIKKKQKTAKNKRRTRHVRFVSLWLHWKREKKQKMKYAKKTKKNRQKRMWQKFEDKTRSIIYSFNCNKSKFFIETNDDCVAKNKMKKR